MAHLNYDGWEPAADEEGAIIAKIRISKFKHGLEKGTTKAVMGLTLIDNVMADDKITGFQEIVMSGTGLSMIASA